jgi:hypothetical protein
MVSQSGAVVVVGSGAELWVVLGVAIVAVDGVSDEGCVGPLEPGAAED